MLKKKNEKKKTTRHLHGLHTQQAAGEGGLGTAAKY